MPAAFTASSYSAALCRGLIEAWTWSLSVLFLDRYSAALCRGLIEAATCSAACGHRVAPAFSVRRGDAHGRETESRMGLLQTVEAPCRSGGLPGSMDPALSGFVFPRKTRCLRPRIRCRDDWTVRDRRAGSRPARRARKVRLLCVRPRLQSGFLCVLQTVLGVWRNGLGCTRIFDFQRGQQARDFR